MRIALGSDHRGGRIARTILTDVLFAERNPETERNVLEPKTTLIGAYLVTGDLSKLGGIVGKSMENLLPNIFQVTNGNSAPSASAIQVDYPEIAAAVASRVSDKTADLGILVCGTGIGMSIVANKFRGVRAATCYNEFTAEMSRLHNDANVLCVPGEMLGPLAAVALVRKWLLTGYEGGRHQTRLDKITAIEDETGL